MGENEYLDSSKSRRWLSVAYRSAEHAASGWNGRLTVNEKCASEVSETDVAVIDAGRQSPDGHCFAVFEIDEMRGREEPWRGCIAPG